MLPFRAGALLVGVSPMAFAKKLRFKDARFRRILPLLLVVLLGAFILLRLIRTPGTQSFASDELDEGYTSANFSYGNRMPWNPDVKLPKQSELSISLEKRNHFPPRNLDLFPRLAKDHVKIVLYVHNRPKYLQVVVESLSKVEGIGETLLIVSHDGYFEEMDKIIKSIRFCQVKQIYAPFSPHLFRDSFPGISPGDCEGKDDASAKHCTGNPDQYGNHRSPKIVSLKHHWWWMMNTVWNGLQETRGYSGHILFIEEDHYIYPNAYRNIQLLTKLKSTRCSDCYAANLAPSDVNSKGEWWDKLIAEKVGNVGYTFNRTVWEMIHLRATGFCFFDDYNWDITMWATVYPSFPKAVHTLRGSRRSAAHFGKCGLHQGQGKTTACIDNGVVNFDLDTIDTVPNINSNWAIHKYTNQGGYQKGFKGWGGWGDKRDHQLCLSFSRMYKPSTY